MLLSNDFIQSIGKNLISLKLPFRYGYAGSYARGTAKSNSDLDVVIDNAENISLDEYMSIYNLLKATKIKFDIINLKSLEREDQSFDKEMISMGLGINHQSAYKNISREVIWFA